MTNHFDSALPHLESLSVFELLRVHRWTLHRLLELGVVRTFNAPQGDWAETLVAEAYKGEIAKKSAKGHDVIVDESRIQVKSGVIHRTKKGSIKSSAIRSWDFEKLVAALFNTDDLGVEKATELLRERIEYSGYYQEHVNAESLPLNARLMSEGTDVTAELQAAAETVNRQYSR